MDGINQHGSRYKKQTNRLHSSYRIRIGKAIFDRVGEKKSCLTLSNIGQVKVPDEMAKYITRFDFILGVQAASPYNCGVLSFGDTLYINFIRNIREPELEYHFGRVLRELEIPVTVESNRGQR